MLSVGVLVGWFILLVLCWPLALLALLLWPIVWIVSLPFRLVGITFEFEKVQRTSSQEVVCDL